MMRILDGLDALVESYDVFLIDVWGVLQDGLQALPHAVETVARLQALGKRIILISNTPSRAVVLEHELETLGFSKDCFSAIVTAGEVVYQEFKKPHFLSLNGGEEIKYFYIGPEERRSLLYATGSIEVDTVSEADLILLCGFNDQEKTMDAYSGIFKTALEKKLPVVCASPDQYIIQNGTSSIPCAGLLAKNFEAMGGTVHYFGKPHRLIYDYIKSLLQKEEKITAIGDSLHTDILGANQAGIHSVLLLDGLVAYHVENDNVDEIKAYIDSNNIYPNDILKDFVVQAL
jgi:HAD superfamily hydrolase (TIGR01459 family)